MADDKKKSDPTISSSSRSDNVEKGRNGKPQPHEAVPVEEGADAAVNQEYVDNPDAGKTSIAQLEVTDDAK